MRERYISTFTIDNKLVEMNTLVVLVATVVAIQLGQHGSHCNPMKGKKSFEKSNSFRKLRKITDMVIKQCVVLENFSVN